MSKYLPCIFPSARWYNPGVGVSKDDGLAKEWHELMGRYHRLSCTLDRELQAAHGIGGSDFEVLQQLAGSPEGSLRMHDLADHVHLTQSALSRLISRLESDGLVDRCVCVDDRRSVITAITDGGRQRYQEARVTQRAILRQDAEAHASPA
jgi:DNA-binding MarR family transcriptional regulator